MSRVAKKKSTRGFRQGLTQTGLYGYRRCLEVRVIGYRYIHTFIQPCCTSRLLWRRGRVSDCHPGDPGSIPVRVRSEYIFLHLSHSDLGRRIFYHLCSKNRGAAQLICAFVFAYPRKRYSHDASQIKDNNLNTSRVILGN